VGALPGTPAQQARLAVAQGRAAQTRRNLERLDPNWRPEVSTYNTLEGQIAHYEAVSRTAETRYAEITQGAIPGFNPTWGRDRLTSELHSGGYILKGEARGPGLIYENSTTGEQVRIMERPLRRYREEPDWKHTFEFYYRYRASRNHGERGHVPIPD
jgi:hypothetical protein